MVHATDTDSKLVKYDLIDWVNSVVLLLIYIYCFLPIENKINTDKKVELSNIFIEGTFHEMFSLFPSTKLFKTYKIKKQFTPSLGP